MGIKFSVSNFLFPKGLARCGRVDRNAPKAKSPEYLLKNLISFFILFVFTFYPSQINSSQSFIKNDIKMQNRGSDKNIKYPSVFELTKEDKDWIEKSLVRMTTREKCAQMIVPWVLGKNYSDDSLGFARMVHLVKDLKVGGLIFSNGDALNEAVDINKMQAISGVPLLISADFESGLGMRLSDGTAFPSNMAIAAARNPDLAFLAGRVIAQESKVIGVYQDYAPDVDINNNPDNPVIGTRSYSESKEIVSEFGSAFIRGATEVRIITTAKHFPGHGNTSVDSHFELPVVKGSRAYLMDNEIYPFIRSIKAGVQAVMVGHLYVPALEEQQEVPATLSKSIVTDLLKNKLGFDGLIITDAMNMQAVTRYYSVAEAAVLAVKAGNDILLMPPDEEIAINALVSAVESGEIDIQRINESVRKILAAKRWLKLQDNRFTNVDKIYGNIAVESNLKLAEEIADRSITLVRNIGKIIPLRAGRYRRVISVVFSFGIGEDSSLVFQKLVKEKFKGASTFILNNKSSKKDFDDVLRSAGRADLVLIPYFMKTPSDERSEKLFKKFRRVIDKLLIVRAPAVLLSFGDPYLLSRFPGYKTYLSAFSDVPVSQKAMMKALMGEINITGRLPVSLPETRYKIGYGIQLMGIHSSFLRKAGTGSTRKN